MSVAVELTADMGYYQIVAKLVVIRASGLVKMGRDAVGARPKPGGRSSDLL